MSPLDASARAEVERLFAVDAPVRLARLATALDALADGSGRPDAVVFEAHALQGAAAIAAKEDIVGLCRSIEDDLSSGVPPARKLRKLSRRVRAAATLDTAKHGPLSRLVPRRFMTQLAAILLLTIVPAFGIAVYDNYHQRAAQRAMIVREATADAAVAAASEAQLVDGGRRLLAALARTLEVLDPSRARCTQLLAGYGGLLRPYMRFAAISRTGHVVCSSPIVADGFSIAHYTIVRKIRETNRFAVGPLQRDREGNTWIILIGRPVRPNTLHADQVGAVLPVSSIQDVIARVDLPPHSTITVFDRYASILARRPDPARYVGTKGNPVSLHTLDVVAGTMEATGVDGVRRVFAYHAAGPWYVSVGVPSGPASTTVTPALIYELLLVAGLGLLGLTLGLLGAQRALGRPIAALTSTARRLGQGDLSARTGLRLRGGELHELAASIDAMADALEAHVVESDRAAAKLKRLADELTQRVHDRTAALGSALEDADRANRAKTAFLSRLSHELRTPLNAIRGFSQLLRSDELTPDQADAAEHIATGADHMTLLVEELLDTTRIETGEFRVDLEPVALGRLLEETVAMSRGLAEEHGVTITEPAVDPQLRVVADPARLEQALLNVVKNAIVYNRRGGTVSLRVSRGAERQIVIDIVDTGAGIAPDALERVFNPYERLGRGPESDGLGLGLALSRRLIEAMGGEINVESDLDIGSRFTIELAEAAFGRNLEVPPKRAPAVRAAEPRLPQRVLYIEDNATSMKLVELLLRGRDIDFAGAATGAEGIAAARADRPDLILLDLQLPDQTGEDVLRTLRAEPSLRAVPIVMLSAQASRDTVRRLLEAGADDYLTKPLEIDRAADLIERLLRREG